MYNRLALLFRVHGLTIAAVAKRCGVSRPTLSAVLAGKYPASPKLASELRTIESELIQSARSILAELLGQEARHVG